MTKQQYTQQGWSLDEMFSGLHDEKIEQTIVQLETVVTGLEAYRPQLTPTITQENFDALLKLYEEGQELISRLFGFGRMLFSANTQDQETHTYLARISQLAAQAQNRTLFISLWWKEVDESVVARLLPNSGDLRYWLEAIRLQKPHTLSESEEKIINLKDVNGAQALNQLYESITNRYTFNLTVDGEELSLTRDQLSTYYYSRNPEMRATAYAKLYEVYSNDAPILGQIYQFMVRDWYSEHVELRHYTSPLNVRNHVNDIPSEVVETLLNVARANSGLFQRYFQLKARWLGMEKLRRFDIYAPVVASDKTYTFEEAAELVLTSFKEFDPHLAELAERVFAENHYDSEARAGKRGGAFCATISPKLTPWVLQTFVGRPRDVSTMAHELGHAIHSLLANHHSILTQQSCLPLAETASTFGEMLLLEKLLSADPDPELLRDLLFSSVDDSYATIIRQSYFSMFEVTAHKAIQEGASVDQVSELYLQNLRDQFGDAVEIDPMFKHEWVAIPHFFNVPFYVYAYAFGQLLALALFQQYKSEGNAMIPRYLDLLAAGGSLAPVELLKKAGVDPYSAEFWQGGFDVIAAQIAQLEELSL